MDSEDLLLYELDVAALGSQLAQALDFREGLRRLDGGRVWKLGDWDREDGVRIPVLLAIVQEASTLETLVTGHLLRHNQPCRLLTPTDQLWSSNLLTFLRSAGGRIEALDQVVALGERGQFVRLPVARVQAEEPPAKAEPAADFRRDGEVWTIGFEGVTAVCPHTNGFQYLAVLLREPGREFDLADLALAAGDQAAPAARCQSEDELSVDRAIGDSGETLDRRALLEIRGRLDEIAQDLANPATPASTIQQLQDERNQLQGFLASAEGQYGKPRRVGDVRKRERDRVRSAIGRARRKIRASHAALDTHLAASIRPGARWSYRPERPISWQVAIG